MKRFEQLKGGFDFHEEGFFTLEIHERGILFLKTRLKYSVSDIEDVSEYDHYDILRHLAKSREQLLLYGHGRSLALPPIIGS